MFRHAVNDWIGFWLTKVQREATAKSEAGDHDAALRLLQPVLAFAPELRNVLAQTFGLHVEASSAYRAEQAHNLRAIVDAKQ